VAATSPAPRGAAEFGTFSPPEAKKSSGISSRVLAPAAVSIGAFVIVLVALIVYFATV
jgi:hypothetical protein